MDVLGPENASHATRQAEAASAQLSHQTGNPGLRVENQLPGASDIASARSFFNPKMDIQAIASPLPAVDHSSAMAMKAASDAISPMLQIIMRLPGHVGIFSSFLECLKNLFMPHDLLANFNPGTLASHIDLGHSAGLTQLGHSLPSLAHPHAVDLSILPSSAHAFQATSHAFFGNVSSAHLHINAFDSWKQSMNVSAGVDINNPQFEGVTGADAHQASNISGQGDSLAGPGISAQAIIPKLSPEQTIFNSKFFESAGNINAGANNLLAANNTTSSITSSASSTAASSLTSSSTHISPSANSINAAIPKVTEHVTAQNSNGLSGMQAKALSLKDVLNKGNIAGHDIAKHVANNPFAKLAANTKLAFQTAQMDTTAITNNAYHVKSGDTLWQTTHQASHQTLSHTESTNCISSPNTTHANGSLANHYTVKSGDNLWKISKNLLGSGDKWTQLYKINTGIVGANPGMIFPGEKLHLSGFDANVVQPQHHVQHIEQLAHHTQQPAISHAQEQVAHHSQPTTPSVAHAQEHAVQHTQAASATVAHGPVVHNNPVIAQAKVQQAPIHQAQPHGLTVEQAPDQVLAGSGGAQAATNTTVNKAAEQAVANKAKSVVSFSLTPDLSFFDSKK